MTTYVLEPCLGRASLTDYGTLFRQAYGRDEKLSAAYLDWSYVANPHGSVIGYDAYCGGELAGHYAIIPRTYVCGASRFMAALSVNTATHPRHQGKGVFVRLAAAAFEAAAAKGVQFVIGAANANSIGGFVRKLGFQQLGQVRLRIGFSAQMSAGQGELGISLDAPWLTWRFRNPARRYHAMPHEDGTTTIRTWVNRVPFNVSRLASALLDQVVTDRPLGKVCPLVPGLTPVFGGSTASSIPLPGRLHPSPWHVIWKTLDPSCEPTLAKRLVLDGLAMDTF